MRRAARVTYSLQVIQMVLGFPEDVILRNIRMDHETGSVIVTIDHPAMPECNEGAYPLMLDWPEISLLFREAAGGKE